MSRGKGIRADHPHCQDELRRSIEKAREESIEYKGGNSDGPAYEYRVPAIDGERGIIQISEPNDEVCGDEVTCGAHSQYTNGQEPG